MGGIIKLFYIYDGFEYKVLDNKIWACEFKFKQLKFKYYIWIVFKNERFGLDQIHHGF